MSQEKTVFEKSKKGRHGYSFDFSELEHVQATDFLPESMLRQSDLKLPELTELDVVRHYTRLSHKNYSIDTNFYPLGSCTMKYNPRINETVASLDGFTKTHPMQYQYTIQGNLRLMYELGELLKGITGMQGVSLQPCAGAQGEFTGLLMIRAYHTANGNPRKKVIIPESAHGTNPASAALCGYEVVTVKCNEQGLMDPSEVEKVLDDDVACLMVTNPSTLGIFESHIKTISNMVHGHGGLVYCDGANLNAILGQVQVADLGVDCMHINLHKTFTTPHGGGGPGAGPVVVSEALLPYLPVPFIKKDGERYVTEYDRPDSIGRVRAFFGNFGMFVRAYTYIREMGKEGLKQVSDMAVLNANYIRAKLKDRFSVSYPSPTLHEVIFSDQTFKHTKVKTLDIAKRLLDFGFHAPTIYFPITVSGALMIEPTETESQETLDEFCDAMIQIFIETQEDPQKVMDAPHSTKLKRLNEVKAAREPKLRELL